MRQEPFALGLLCARITMVFGWLSLVGGFALGIAIMVSADRPDPLIDTDAGWWAMIGGVASWAFLVAVGSAVTATLRTRTEVLAQLHELRQWAERPPPAPSAAGRLRADR